MSKRFKKYQEDGVEAALRAAAREAQRQEAIDYYTSVLEKVDIPAFAEELQEDLKERRVIFGKRPLCPFLRPNFIGRDQLDLLSTAVSGVTGAIHSLTRRIVDSVELQKFLGLTDMERKLTEVSPGYESFSVTSRLDSFLLGGKVRFVEYNAESPAGIGFNDEMSTAFMNNPVMSKFRERYACSPQYTGDELLRSLIQAYHEWGGNFKPVIGIIDYEDLPTEYEFEILKDFFGSRGFKSVVCDPRKVEFKNDKLYANGVEIDLVYRRLLTNEFLDHFDDNQQLWEAYKSGKVCFANSFRSKYFHKKAIFALITDPAYQDQMTYEQLYAVYTHVPWTRKMHECCTTNPEGKPIDLLPWVAKNRHSLVLKPNDEYGGKGIYVGWEMSESEWDEAIKVALNPENYYLVQTKVDVSREHYPSYEGGKLVWGEYTVDLDPFVFNQKVQGLLTRLSATALCNVTAGGGGVPTFILE